MEPCIKCREREGYPTLGGYCHICARDHKLFEMRAIADLAELTWSNYADAIYHVEAAMGLRPPPSDRPDPHGVQGEPVTGTVSIERGRSNRFSSPMKQGSGRSTNHGLSEDDLT